MSLAQPKRADPLWQRTNGRSEHGQVTGQVTDLPALLVLFDEFHAIQPVGCSIELTTQEAAILLKLCVKSRLQSMTSYPPHC
jgi:hypothetical protein